MRAGWQTIPMADLCSIQSGKSDTQDAIPDGEYVFFDRSKTIKRSARFLRDCEALIIPGEGTEFLPRHFNGKFDLHQRAYALFNFSPNVDVRFLFHYLHHVADYFPRVAVGATVKSLRLRHFEQLPVVLAPLLQQHRIVAILDEAFDGIATGKALAEKNLENSRSLFESYLQSVFTQRGPGWTQKNLGDVAVFRNGINFNKSSKGTPIKILGVKNFQDAFWAPVDHLDSIVPDGAVPDNDTLREGDIVFVRSNGNPALIGRCLIIGKITNRTTHSGFTIKARLQTSEILPTYLGHFLKSSAIRQQMIDGGNGANIKSLNQGTLSRLEIPFPSITDQARMVENIEAFQNESQRLEDIYQQKLTALDNLKKSLLHQAFTGQL